MTKRNITVDGTKYQWCVGGQGAVIWAHDRKQRHAKLFDLVGLTWDAFERGHYKKTADGEIRPGHVAEWIKRFVSGQPS